MSTLLTGFPGFIGRRLAAKLLGDDSGLRLVALVEPRMLEAAKFQAEVWVREEMDRVPTTIVRPAIVVGDSRTGETQKFDGPYFILRVIAQAERARRAAPNFGRSAAPFNVVPVDFVVDSIA